MFRFGVTLPAENGARSGGASLQNSFIDLNNDDTVRGRAYVQLENTGGSSA